MGYRPAVTNGVVVLLTLTATWPAVLSPARQAAPPDRAAPADATADPFRPEVHFTPARNWMNDPNGLVYHDGEYHLFYQHNPGGVQWGDISWGHAVSTDLVHWRELPLAIAHDDHEMIFSGSAVVDQHNTSGFGSLGRPPLVAIYTSAPKAGGVQAQSLAYSTDRGRTWTKYAGNPVLDIGSAEFRDPKVQWHAASRRWVMAIALATERKVRFYSSEDLKHWSFLSDFGPAGAVGGVWECPDLFPLPLDGNPRKRKWVLVVSLNPGGLQGGSATQYFVGDFDGTTFTPDDEGRYTPPPGHDVQNFEATGYGDWAATGTAFGDGPAAGTLAGQSPVTGHAGAALANSFHGGDASTGTLTSPPFTATTPYLNFLIGGGRHPHQAGTVRHREPAPAGTVLTDFEGGSYGGWEVTGDAFGSAPAGGTLPGQQPVSGWLGAGLVNTFLGGDAAVGTLTSPPFTIDRPYLNFLVAGGYHPASTAEPTAVNLLVNGAVVRTATGNDSEMLNWASWDVRELSGKQARLQVVDHNRGGWGHIVLDHVVLSETRARPVSTETTVNLLVDGAVVQSRTGSDSETLDWAHFDLRPFLGRQVQVEVVDMNTGGWGHVLADRFVAADTPATSALERVRWVDHGADYYAAVSWDNAPDGRRYMIGWMNNWQYAGAVPTGSWRGAMSVPREMSLRTVQGRPRLVQQPVRGLAALHGERVATARDLVVGPGETALGQQIRGQALDIVVSFTVRDAARFGLKVRAGAGGETVIGYDTATREVYVDRTRSGSVEFGRQFGAVHRAPIVAQNGRIRLRVLLDRSSVEVFGGDGQTVITDQIFPASGSEDVRFFADGGTVGLERLTVTRLVSYQGASARPR